MPWIVLIGVLILPFVLKAYRRRLAARLGLLVYSLACAVASVYCFWEVGRLREELQASHRYELPSSPGRHQLAIRPMTQTSMKGVLHGGAGVVPRATIEKFQWTFLGQVPALWFEPRPYDEPEPGDTLLFYVDWPSSPPYRLEYDVPEGMTDALAPRVLVVTHDRSARHILEDGLAVIRFLAWALGLWALLWVVVQVVQERGKHRLVDDV